MERRGIGAQARHTVSATIFWFVAALLLLSSAIAKFIRTGDVTWSRIDIFGHGHQLHISPQAVTRHSVGRWTAKQSVHSCHRISQALAETVQVVLVKAHGAVALAAGHNVQLPSNRAREWFGC